MFTRVNGYVPENMPLSYLSFCHRCSEFKLEVKPQVGLAFCCWLLYYSLFSVHMRRDDSWENSLPTTSNTKGSIINEWPVCPSATPSTRVLLVS